MAVKDKKYCPKILGVFLLSWGVFLDFEEPDSSLDSLDRFPRLPLHPGVLEFLYEVLVVLLPDSGILRKVILPVLYVEWGGHARLEDGEPDEASHRGKVPHARLLAALLKRKTNEFSLRGLVR